MRDEDVVLLFVEVTGTEAMRGDPTIYWVRPDKLKYANSHPAKDIWVILHYAKPVEKFVFIKPTAGKAYTYTNKDIRGAGERMVEFRDGEPEVKTQAEFQVHLMARTQAGARTLITSLDWFNPSKTTFIEVYAASYLGAYAAANSVTKVEDQPFSTALDLAVSTWEKFNDHINSERSNSAINLPIGIETTSNEVTVMPPNSPSIVKSTPKIASKSEMSVPPKPNPFASIIRI